MLLLPHLLHSKCSLVGVDVVEHVRVLVSAQPFVFPVEPNGQVGTQKLSLDFIVRNVAGVKVLDAVFI